MGEKTKTREITIIDEGGTFGVILKKFRSKKYDFEGLKLLRRLLSNEKARILHTIKTQDPSSIYDLAKKLKRDFKSVSSDLNLLKKFGFIEFVSEKSGSRERLKPILSADSINIKIKI